MPLVLKAIQDTPLDIQAHIDAAQNERAGAVATFVGVVRNHDPEMDGEVVQLDYSAHPQAEEFLESVVNDVLAQYDPSGEARVAVSHRIGSLRVGDLAIVAAVATAHRAAAFDLCERIVEDIKHKVPVWKHQHTADGSSAWSGIA